MRKPKKEKLHPLSKYFTVSQFEYLKRADKLISYPVDLIEAVIYLPENPDMSYIEEMTVKHLENDYGFQVVHAPVTKSKSLFNPKMGIGKGVQTDLEQIIKEVKIGVGTNFTDTRDPKGANKRIFADKDKNWQIMYIGSMIPNYSISKLSFQINLDHGIYVITE